MPFFNRPKREYRWVPGYGGSLLVRQYDADGKIVSAPGIHFDVDLYVIQNIFLNEDTTHSGDVGGTSRTRVGADWNFAAVLSFPGKAFGEELVASFPEEVTVLGSSRGVAITFNIGDPLYWANLSELPRSYRGKALLDMVSPAVNTINKKVVKLNITGSGDGLLYAYVGENAVHPIGWE